MSLIAAQGSIAIATSPPRGFARAASAREGVAMRRRAIALIAAVALGGWTGRGWGQVLFDPLAVVCQESGGCATCEGERGRCDSELASCNGGLETCRSERTACQSELGDCEAELESCEAALGECARFPATGQDRTVIAGEDGNPAHGEPLAYVDNGNGTITDLNTGLTWEKKNKGDGTRDLANPHDADNGYAWAGVCSDDDAECGTDADCQAGATCDLATVGQGLTIFEWLEELNGQSFAGYSDWRVPNIRELESIVDYGEVYPSVDPVFHTRKRCRAGCSDLTDPGCSCTPLSGSYWSSTTVEPDVDSAWVVLFSEGSTWMRRKFDTNRVRAVRGGSR